MMKHPAPPPAWTTALAAVLLSIVPMSVAVAGDMETAPDADAAAAFLREAILEAARNDQADPVQAVFDRLRDGTGIDIELALDDGNGQPIEPELHCPDGIPATDCRALLGYVSGPDNGYEGEGHIADLTLIDLDGDGLRDLVSDYYSGGTGLYSMIDLVRQDPAHGFNRSQDDPETHRQRMNYSINGRGGDQAFEILRIHGRPYVVYRDSFYGRDTITIEKPFAPVDQRAQLEVRYRYRHRARQSGNSPEGERDDEATAGLLAAVNRELSERAWAGTNVDGEAGRCPSTSEEDEEWPWHGAGHYMLEFTWSFPVRSAGRCLGATVVNFLSSYRMDQSACCALWIYGPGHEEIATFDLVTERRVASVQAGEQGGPGPGLFE